MRPSERAQYLALFGIWIVGGNSKMRSVADWFIHGDIDWEWFQQNGRKWSPVISGALFGAAWWVWADALVYEHVEAGSPPPFKYNWPGIIATIALVLINLVSRDDLAEISSSGEDGADVSV